MDGGGRSFVFNGWRVSSFAWPLRRPWATRGETVRGTPLSTIYTDYLSSLLADGSRNVDVLAVQVLARLRRDLSHQLKKRGLWTLSPAMLGISGSSWNSDTLAELAHEAYLYIFSERLRNLAPQLAIRDNVDGLVVLNLKYCLTHLQRTADPIGYRVFEIARSAIGKAVESGRLHLLGDSRRICNETVLGFRRRGDPQHAASAAEIEVYVPAWNEDLLPHLMTARGRGVTKVVERLRDHVLALKCGGVSGFRFGDVVDPLKRDVRRRWAAVWDQAAGETTAEVGKAGVSAKVRVFQPAVYNDERSLPWLLECVSSSISQRRDDSESEGEGLWKLWEYIRGFTLDSDPSCGGCKLPSYSALGKLLGIYRERIPRLLEILGRLVEACRSREGFSSPKEPLTCSAKRAILKKAL